jgi:hypothetical protein
MELMTVPRESVVKDQPEILQRVVLGLGGRAGKGRGLTMIRPSSDTNQIQRVVMARALLKD